MANTAYYEAPSAKAAALVVFDSTQVIEAFPLKRLSVIGRKTSHSQCDIPLPSPIVSRVHGQIGMTDAGWFYRDMGSTNGTFLNGSRIDRKGDAGNAAVALKEGDILGFDIVQGSAHHPDRLFALFTQIVPPSCSWQTLPLKDSFAEICIGRGVGTGIRVEDQSISEKHASFFHSQEGWAIIDHNSTNGVYLNGKKMTSPRYLEKVSSVRVADAYFLFTQECLLYSSGVLHRQSPEPNTAVRVEKQENQRPELIIHIEERSVVQRFKKKMLLQDIDLSVSDGEMVLILGGSGAGKTTFLHAVMGYEKAVGEILYRDTDIYEEYEQMKYEIGFVPQQDLLREGDTVYNTLYNAAEMRLARNLSDQGREERIREVLNELGLGQEKDSLVSKLSGGQRKRLSIAVEYIADPSLFFLDEPDSGLDDVMGRSLMENLRHIADRGKIVMVITHSPERAPELFDKVLVLAKSQEDNSGHLAFFGPVDEAFAFFEASSFREIVKKINRHDENGEGLADRYIRKYREREEKLH